MVRLGLALVLFLMIALIAIGLIFKPTVEHWVMGGNEYYEAPPALTQRGMAIRAEVWRQYPDYAFGHGAIALVAFGGAINIALSMAKLKEQNEDEITN